MHVLPPGPDDVVIEWETFGGAGLPRVGSTDLIVRANGAVSVGERFSGGAGGVISQADLQGLLSEILDDGGFFGLDGVRLTSDLEAARSRRLEVAPRSSDSTISVPLGPPYIDAAGTRIDVSADGRRHEVVFDGLAAAARDYPEVAGVGALRTIEMRLLTLAERIAAEASP